MAYAFVQAVATPPSGAGSTIAVTVATVGTSNLVCGCCTFDSAATLSVSSPNPITDNGTGGTWVVADQILDSGNGQRVASFYGYGWSVGPTVITANLTSSVAARAIVVSEFSGKPAGDPIDGTNHQGLNTTSTTAPKSGSGNQTPSQANCLVWGCGARTDASSAGSSFFTAGTNFTKRSGDETTTNGEIAICGEDWIQTTATAVNAQFTTTSGTYTVCQIIFKLTAAASPDTPSVTDAITTGEAATPMLLSFTNSTDALTMGDTMTPELFSFINLTE